MWVLPDRNDIEHGAASPFGNLEVVNTVSKMDSVVLTVVLDLLIVLDRLDYQCTKSVHFSPRCELECCRE